MSETNNSLPWITFDGASVPSSLVSVCTVGDGWGYSHNSYQYCEADWFKQHLFQGKSLFVGMPIGDGYFYGNQSSYRWNCVVTVLPGGKIMVHSDVAGNRRGSSSSYMARWIIQATFNLPSASVESLDFGFQGQEISMAGTAKLLIS